MMGAWLLLDPSPARVTTRRAARPIVARRVALAAALDRVIPKDNFPSATGAGVMTS